jgi:competence protein ComEC
MVSVMISQQLRLHDGWWLVISLPWIVLGWRAHGIVLLCGLILLATVAGCLRGTQYMDKKDVYGRLEGQNVLLAGQASSDAVYGNKHQLVFDLRDARLARDGQRLVGTLQISGFGESMVYKGDRIEVRGKLFTSRGNNSGRISYATLTLLSRGQSMIDDVRRRFAAGMQSTVPEPAASFGMGLLVGQRNTLPKDVSEQLQKVGLTHIIAVSGYNLTIIMQAVGRVMKKRSKFQYMFLSIGLMLTFLLLTGQSPSIVRASVVCGLGLWAWWYGRTIKPIVLLMTAAAITIAANPLYAWGNVSWMLSFLAFFGVLVVSPIIMHRWHSGREPGFIAGIIIESLCAEVMTLPYVLFIFGQMSTVATFSNLLVASFVPLAMLCSVIAGLVGMICPTVAGWLSWPATMVMTYMLDVVHILSEIPHAFVEGIGFSVWMMVSSYGLVGIMLWIAWHRGHQNGIITDNTERNEKE